MFWFMLSSIKYGPTIVIIRVPADIIFPEIKKNREIRTHVSRNVPYCLVILSANPPLYVSKIYERLLTITSVALFYDRSQRVKVTDTLIVFLRYDLRVSYP